MVSLSPARRQGRAASGFASKLAILACMLVALLCFLPAVTAEEEKKENDFGTVIGIDLGTTYSCVA
jgi:heat shock protein 5